MWVFYTFLWVLFLAVILPALLVLIGLPFKVNKGLRFFDDGSSVQQYELPKWLRWLHNPKDGLTGDHRGWYWNDKMNGKPAWFKMWWWSGVRNSWNYLKRHIIGINVQDYTVTKIRGDDYVRDDFRNTGFQILKATSRDGRRLNKYSLYWVRRWSDSNRAIVVQLGWKIKLSHNEVTEPKWVGVTFEPNPFKDIS